MTWKKCQGFSADSKEAVINTEKALFEFRMTR